MSPAKNGVLWDQETRLLRVREVAERLAISPSVAWKLTANGELRTVRIGRSIRIRPRDLEAYLDSVSSDS